MTFKKKSAESVSLRQRKISNQLNTSRATEEAGMKDEGKKLRGWLLLEVELLIFRISLIKKRKMQRIKKKRLLRKQKPGRTDMKRSFLG